MKLITQQKFEQLLFFSLVLISIVPVLVFKHFPTLDGPAHLYNSNLLGHLITGDSFLKQYFTLNSLSTPNWLGHILILGFQRVFGAIVAEKIIVITCIAGLAYSYRFLISTLNKNHLQSTFIILPFTYSFFLFLGFFNFILSTIFLLITLSLFIKLINSYNPFLHILAALSLLLTYFSHPFGFFAFELLVGIFGINILIKEIPKKNFSEIVSLGTITISLVTIPSILYIIYAGKGIVALSNERVPILELIRWLYKLRSLIVFNFGREQIYTISIFASIIILSLLIIFKKFVHKNPNNSYPKNYIWLISGIVLLLLYFTLPNQINSGGYVSDRLNYLFFIFILIWISTFNWDKKIIATFCTIAIICHLGLMTYYTKQIYWLNKSAENIHSLAKKVKPNSVILPIGSHPNWMLGHISNYIGADKKVVLLENYEAYTGYFPILWDWKSIPNITLGNTNLNDVCLSSFETEFNKTFLRKIDYIVLTKNPNAQGICKAKVDSIINCSYKKIYTSEDNAFELFELINNDLP